MPQNFTLPCPNCGSHATHYSAGSVEVTAEGDVYHSEGWVCERCGLRDAPAEDWRTFTSAEDEDFD